MTNQHPITPPPIVREQLQLESPFKVVSLEREDYMIDRAAQWGADQELKACCEWLECNYNYNYPQVNHPLRAARRPKPPSLKEQALKVLESAPLNADEHALIRRALEALDD